MLIYRALWSIVVLILQRSSLKMARVDFVWEAIDVWQCVFGLYLHWVFVHNHRFGCYSRIEQSEILAWLILVRICISVHELNRDRFYLFLLFKEPFVTPCTRLIGYYHKCYERWENIKSILRFSHWNFLLNNHIFFIDHENDSIFLIINLLLWHSLVCLWLIGSYRFNRVRRDTSDDHLCSHLKSCFLWCNTLDMHEYSVSGLGRIIESVIETFDHYRVFRIKQTGSLIKSHLHTTVVIKWKQHIVVIVDVAAPESRIVGTELVVTYRLRCEGSLWLNCHLFFCLHV